jgi:hypothetical protein
MGLALSALLLRGPVAQAGQVVLADPLTSWPLSFGAQGPVMMMQADGLHIYEAKSFSNFIVYPGFTFKDMDASVTVTAKVAGPGDAGLLFWGNAQGDYYMCSVSPVAGSFDIFHRTVTNNSGAWVSIVPWTKDPHIKTGANAVNTIRVVTKGNSIQLFINGAAIGHLFVQAPAAGGGVGMTAEGGAGGPSDFIFSNLTVSQ